MRDLNVRVIGYNLLVKIDENDRERDGIIMDSQLDTMRSKVVAVGHLIEDVKPNDIVTSVKNKKIKTIIDDEEYYLIRYQEILLFQR